MALPSFAASVFLSWESPSTNEDGTPLTDLAGYKIYYGTSSGNYSDYIDIGKKTAYTISNLNNGRTYYFVVTAYNTAKIESGYSNEVSKTVGPAVPDPGQQNSLNVTKAGSGSGVVTSSPAGISCGSDCSEVYTSGTVVTLTATPDANSSFGGWTGACTGNGTCTVTMDAAKSVSPLFVAKGLTITATAGSGGSVSPSGAVSVNYGGNQNFTITPNANYTIGSVVVDGSSAGAVTSYSFSNVTGNHSISVSFTQNDSTDTDAVITLPKTGQTTVYASGDDGNIQAGAAWPEERFTDNGDGTITDSLTGLMWLKDGGCLKTNWKNSASTLAGLNNQQIQNTCSGYAGNYTDWRLPTINELKSLVNYGSADSAQWLDSKGFVNVKSTFYWSSTTYLGNPSYAWAIKTYSGMEARANKYKRYYIFPVRNISTGHFIAKLPKTGQTVSFAENDDGSVQPGVEWPVQRFSDNGDGTITDSLTGRMWLKDGDCLRTNWKNALDTLKDLNSQQIRKNCAGYTGSYADWRLPNVKELESLLNYGSADLSQWLNSQGFVRMKASSYWSSTTYSRDEMNAWAVNLKKIRKISIEKHYKYRALPVRGGNLSVK
jgi:hypothetical protein